MERVDSSRSRSNGQLDSGEMIAYRSIDLLSSPILAYLLKATKESDRRRGDQCLPLS